MPIIDGSEVNRLMTDADAPNRARKTDRYVKMPPSIGPNQAPLRSRLR